jgi:hypothetical protein
MPMNYQMPTPQSYQQAPFSRPQGNNAPRAPPVQRQEEPRRADPPTKKSVPLGEIPIDEVCLAEDVNDDFSFEVASEAMSKLSIHSSASKGDKEYAKKF